MKIYAYSIYEPMSGVTHMEEIHSPTTDNDQSEDDEIQECTSVSSTSSTASIVPLRNSSQERTTLCTPTLLQIRLESSSSQRPNETRRPHCIICLEVMESFPENTYQRLMVSNIPVHLVCSCKFMAHKTCLEEWLQRKLACPICHCSARLQPRPGQRLHRSNRTYQRLLDSEETQQANYRMYIRGQYCAQCIQCACFFSFFGTLVWISYAYTHLQ